MTRAPSQLSSHSTASYCSTTELVPHRRAARREKRTFSQRLFSWPWRKEPSEDSEMNHLGMPTEDKPEGGGGKRKELSIWHGWQLVLFDSWLNVLVLLIPTSWILKLATTNSDTLIFTSCILAMIPLVKMHDLATGVLARRIGGSKTGLLNASMSNVVELVVAIIALRKCELRIVQSSLIGSMLSKMLLILGMCFFAGGTRFSSQDFDSTATQIHSSLLGISVGAVCLPAAFHFALTYTIAGGVETSLAEQKQDLLRMSHGVGIVLLFIYVSYLVFQLWSHTHLFQDSTKASDKLPVTVSVRSVTQRVRRKSGNSTHKRRHSQTSSIRSMQTVQTAQTTHSKQSFAISVIDHSEKPSTLLEVPETSYSDSLRSDPSCGRSPYRYNVAPGTDNMRGRSAYLLSPLGSASQVTLCVNEFGMRAPQQNSTVRLVPERHSHGDYDEEHLREDSSSDSLYDGQGRSTSGSSGSDGERNTSLRNDLLRSPSGAHPPAHGKTRYVGLDGNEASEVHMENRGCDGTQENELALRSQVATPHEEPEMSWTMTLALLTVVTVLVAVNSEWLVDSMDSLSPYISKEWVGLILLPTVSSVPECITAINVSVRDQLSLSISVAIGSTIQTALFVIPSMVLLGWALDKPLAMLFDPFESVVLYISVHIMGYVVADGKSNWLEGVILVCLYVIIAVTFWFYPGSNFSSTLAVCSG
ncbi:Sodium/calcium exchanger protein-domain-containing protein [Sparassis latifolia]